MILCKSGLIKGFRPGGSRVRTKFYGSIIDPGSEKVLNI